MEPDENGLDFTNSSRCPKCNRCVPHPDFQEMPIEDDCPWCGASLQWEYDNDDEGKLYCWLEENQGNYIDRGIKPGGW